MSPKRTKIDAGEKWTKEADEKTPLGSSAHDLGGARTLPAKFKQTAFASICSVAPKKCCLAAATILLCVKEWQKNRMVFLNGFFQLFFSYIFFTLILYLFYHYRFTLTILNLPLQMWGHLWIPPRQAPLWRHGHLIPISTLPPGSLCLSQRKQHQWPQQQQQDVLRGPSPGVRWRDGLSLWRWWNWVLWWKEKAE